MYNEKGECLNILTIEIDGSFNTRKGEDGTSSSSFEIGGGGGFKDV